MTDGAQYSKTKVRTDGYKVEYDKKSDQTVKWANTLVKYLVIVLVITYTHHLSIINITTYSQNGNESICVSY